MQEKLQQGYDIGAGNAKDLQLLFQQVAPEFPSQAVEILSIIPSYPLIIQLLSAMICLGCSALYHMIKDKSEEAHLIYSRLDYAGISLLIFGGCYPFIYYCFACDDVFWLKAMFLSILFTFALMCTIVTFIPKFESPKFRAVRAFMFIGFGLCPIVPM
mmetsp:Transcript_9895/g.13408  ORF Transcript_9895/g.13408 Transcript_9895/m.13408 type:complete len:158 (-) Transcript_9895:313-786(-)